ncbi:MAG: class I adenylate-forming enzyme family protein [Planctomycetota bacterium]
MSTSSIVIETSRLIDFLDLHARNRPNDASLWLSGEDETGRCLRRQLSSISWRELRVLVDQMANRLAAQKAQAILYASQCDSSDVIVSLACARAGLIEIPLDASSGEGFIDACRESIDGFWIGRETKRDWLTNSDIERDLIEDGPLWDSRNSRHPTDDALILFTSGTSGKPKGVVLSHQSLISNARAKLAVVPNAHHDRRLMLLSISHAYARTSCMGTWLLSGCTIAVSRGYEGWCELAIAFNPTHCNLVPSVIERVLIRDEFPSSLDQLGCGGAALRRDAFEALKERGVTPIQGYGLTEAGPVIATQSPSNSIPQRCGEFVAGWEHRIEDNGQLFVRGKHQMTRYWNNPTETSRRISEDGWLDTGDLVRLCEQSNQLEIVGRNDDRLTLSNGHTIDPAAIESRIRQVPGIQDAVLTVRDDERSIVLWLASDRKPNAGKRELIQPELTDANVRELESIFSTMPTWQRPAETRFFEIPDSKRREMVNRKGEVRRTSLLRYLARQ